MKKYTVRITIVCVLSALMLILTGCCSHEWQEATCVSPEKCMLCGETQGVLTDNHSWEPATCYTPQTCSLCGATSGKKQEHWFSLQTCTAPEICRYCGETRGEPRGHHYFSQECSWCDEEYEPLLYGSEYGFKTLSQMGDALIDIIGYSLNDYGGKIIVRVDDKGKDNFVKFSNGYLFMCWYQIVDGKCEFDFSLNDVQHSYNAISNDCMLLDNGWSDELIIVERKTSEKYHKGFVTLVMDDTSVGGVVSSWLDGWFVPYSLIDWEEGVKPASEEEYGKNTYELTLKY